MTEIDVKMDDFSRLIKSIEDKSENRDGLRYDEYACKFS
jgi:hypothetical protein